MVYLEGDYERIGNVVSMSDNVEAAKRLYITLHTLV